MQKALLTTRSGWAMAQISTRDCIARAQALKPCTYDLSNSRVSHWLGWAAKQAMTTRDNMEHLSMPDLEYSPGRRLMPKSNLRHAAPFDWISPRKRCKDHPN
jgi:hypothetical protein